MEMEQGLPARGRVQVEEWAVEQAGEEWAVIVPVPAPAVIAYVPVVERKSLIRQGFPAIQ